MTTVFAVNANRDIFATPNGRLALRTDLDAVVQYAEHAVRAQLGEMIYAADRGVDYLNTVFASPPNLLQFEAQVRTALLRLPQVTSVTNFNITVANNTASYTITIETLFGTGVLNGNV